MARGYDPLYRSTRGSVVTWHYNNLKGDDNQWLDPQSGTTYHKPDEVDIESRPAVHTSTSYNLFSNTTSLTDYEWHSHSFGFNVAVAAFSMTNAGGYLQHVLESGRQVIVHNQASISTYKMSMFSPDIMRYMEEDGRNQSQTFFAKEQAALPAARSTTADKEAYRDFINKFGTHYVEDSIFGGGLDYYCVVNSTLFDKMTTKWIFKQVNIAFSIYNFAFGFGAGSNHSVSDLDQLFQTHSQMLLVASGGDIAKVQSGDYSQWMSTVHLNPAPVEPTFKNISDIFYDPTRASLMKQAVEEYFTNAPHVTPQPCTEAPGSLVSWGDFGAMQEKKQKKAKAMQEQEKASTPSLRAGAPASLSTPNAIPIPGVSNAGLGQGFDAKRGEYKLPVGASLTYSQEKQWYDPIQQETFLIPDELDFSDTPCACFREKSWMIQNATAAWTSETDWWGISVGYGTTSYSVGVSFSQLVANIRSELHNFTWGATLVDRSQELYALDFATTIPNLSPMFMQAVNSLPATGGQAYTTFLAYWGTHYISGAKFGGHCNFTVTYDKSLTTTKSQHYVDDQIGIQVSIMMKSQGISFDIGMGLDSGSGEIHIDTLFKDNSVHAYECVGGDLDYLAAGDYESWRASLRKNPAMIPHSQRLRPISDLVMDPTRRALLKTAVDSYMNQK
jgi:hypothetical protein